MSILYTDVKHLIGINIFSDNYETTIYFGEFDCKNFKNVLYV